MQSIAIVSSQAFSLANFRGSLIRELVGRGVVVYALAPDFDAAAHAAVAALGATPVKYSLSRTGMNPLRDVADVFRLRSLLRSLAPDVMLAYFIKPVIYGSMAAWLAGVSKRFSMIEGVGYVFMDDVSARSSTRRRLLRTIVSLVYKLALRRNQKVFFLNSDDSEQFIRDKLVAWEQVVQIDGIGVDLDHYAVAPAVTRSMTFLLMARMLNEKGIYDFIEAARKVRMRFADTRFVLLGGTDCNPGSVSESELNGWVEEGLVEWPGQVGDVRPWIARASVFVLPSYREGLPRSTQEAMAMGRPVITTDAVGCRGTVQNGINGFLVPIRSPEALAEAMLRFVESPELIQTMGEASRRIAEGRFDVRAINRQILEALGVAS